VWDGVRWAVPTGYQTLATYYNKDLYNESGLAYPADDWTLTQLISDGKAMVRDVNGDGNPDRWGLSWLYGYPFSLVHYGGQVADPEWRRIRVNNPVSVEALSKWTRWQYEFEITPINHGSLAMLALHDRERQHRRVRGGPQPAVQHQGSARHRRRADAGDPGSVQRRDRAVRPVRIGPGGVPGIDGLRVKR